MGESKRRKQLDTNYGTKLYSIEFLDYESWKAKLPDGQLPYSIDDFDEETLKECFENKSLWGGNIKVEDRCYNFTAFIEEFKEDGTLQMEFSYELIDNQKDKRIIERQEKKIVQEITDTITAEYKQLYFDKSEKLGQQKLKPRVEVVEDFFDD